MATATVNVKGQITIPVQVRATLGLRPRDEIEAAMYSVERLKGMIRKPKVNVSVDDMNAVFALKE